MHKNPPLVPVVGQIKPIHVLLNYLFKVHLHLDLPRALLLSRFSTKLSTKLFYPPDVPQALPVSFFLI